MFCPQCGQQAAEGVRFCPKCGLSLTPHAALLASYQPAAASANVAPQAPALTRKRINTRRAAKLMFFSVVLFPVFLGFCFAVDGGEPLLVPLTLFFVGLAWWLYARLFGDDLTQVTHHTSRRDLEAGADNPALGAAQFVPASLFNQQRANTSEMSPPHSVTENTTTLLDKDA